MAAISKIKIKNWTMVPQFVAKQYFMGQIDWKLYQNNFFSLCFKFGSL